MAGRTLGAFLAEQPLKRSRPASKWRADRDMVEEELEALWRAQAPHHPDLLTDALKERLSQAIFFQRPTFWRTKTLGKCRLEPDAPLCPKGSWLGQRFLMLQRLSNLRFAFGNQRPLDDEERKAVLPELERRPHLTFGQIRKLLKPLWQVGDQATNRFNFEVMAGGSRQDKTQIPGNLVEAKLVAVFGAAWDHHHPAREQIRREIFDRLHAIHYCRIGNKRIEIRPVEDEVAEKHRFIAAAEAEYGLAPEQALALAEWTPHAGWLRFSAKAIEKLLPLLEAGRGLSEAMDEAYPGHRDPNVEGLQRLPSHPRQMPDLRNPTVARTLTELRKVTNNLLRVYGRPDVIRIELARDLKLPERVKDELDTRQRQQETLRKRGREELQKNGFADPSRDDIEKWLLWQECKETCPYTGRTIAFSALFGAPPEFEVEHILPRSRSFDNGFSNKTVSEIALNRRKGNRTPFEFFRHDPERLQWLRDHLAKLGEREGPGRGLPMAKIKRLLREDYGDADDRDFVARQLNDTAYIAREARDFLARLGLPVEPCNGRVTAQLRDAWGLNKILNPDGWGKSRADHRHHAIDALAVALTTPALVKRLSEAYARDEQRERPKLDPPWPGLWAEAKDAVEPIVVSHRALRKASGPLHKETTLGDTGEEVVEKGVTYRFYVTRKPVEQLSRSQIELIRDDRIREIVRAHVEARGGDPKKACPPYPVLVSKKGGEAREIRRVRICLKQQPGLMVPVRPSKGAYADPGENHHMAIFQTAEGKFEYEIVSRFEATRRVAKRQPVVRRSNGNDRRFVMSLGIGELLEFPNESGPPSYRIVTSVWSAGPIVLQDARDAQGGVWKRPSASSLLRMGARKVRVDPIGRVTPAND
jgi:CRISPR-associated endonuclease Csn1